MEPSRTNLSLPRFASNRHGFDFFVFESTVEKKSRRIPSKSQFEQPFPMSYNPLLEESMTSDPTSAIKREVHRLIDLQIETLRQNSSLNSSELLDYNARSKRIRSLYGELDRMARTKFDLKFARAS